MFWPTRKITCVLVILISCSLSVIKCQKYRICVVDGKGGFKKSAQYCAKLDNGDSKVECLVAPDRLDCLRRLSKGSADFSVFTPEDLITATNSQIEILLTNELRYTTDKYEYEVVAVFHNDVGIKSRHDLRDKRYCHPGYGYETDWTRVLANYFESSVVLPQCNPQYTITENRIKATSDFFKASCKAGPWVNNPADDRHLKSKYPNLCSLCNNPETCSMNDKYWGRRGPLFCLTDGAGDITWARLDDVKVHFGLTPGGSEDDPKDYSLLCPDDKVMPVNSTNPCVWVVKPWPVVAARRTVAQEIQEIVSSISYNDASIWKANLFNLIESSHLTVEKLEPMEPIESYLDRATGFLSANSFSGCHPPRTVHICTTSIIENKKCDWLRETAAVYGVEPDLDCIKADNTTHCMMALEKGVAEVVMIPGDLVHTAVRDFNLTTLFYETVNDDSKYITAAVTKTGSTISNYNDLRGKRACFPTYDGIAWNSVARKLYEMKLIDDCNTETALSKFFGPTCVPGLPSTAPSSLKQQCDQEFVNGDLGALHCLTSGQGDVAFVSKNSIRKFVEDQRDSIRNRYKSSDFQFVCDVDKEPCYFSWAPIGYGMVRRNNTDVMLNDTLNIFLQLDKLFGRNFESITTPFTMYGRYDGMTDLLFHDATVRLRNVPVAKNFESSQKVFDEDFLQKQFECVITSGQNAVLSLSIYIVTAVVLFVSTWLR